MKCVACGRMQQIACKPKSVSSVVPRSCELSARWVGVDGAKVRMARVEVGHPGNPCATAARRSPEKRWLLKHQAETPRFMKWGQGKGFGKAQLNLVSRKLRGSGDVSFSFFPLSVPKCCSFELDLFKSTVQILHVQHRMVAQETNNHNRARNRCAKPERF